MRKLRTTDHRDDFDCPCLPAVVQHFDTCSHQKHEIIHDPYVARARRDEGHP